MKKILFTLAVAATSVLSAQTKQGTSFVGVSTKSLTALEFSTQKGAQQFQVGFDAGHFVANNTAVIFGAGYSGSKEKGVRYTDAISYQAGVKHYLLGKFPLQADFNGVDNNQFVGFQAGYAWFPSDKISIEPVARYNIALDEGGINKFSVGVGFNYFFKF